MKVFLDLMWYFKQEKKSYLTGIFLLLVVAALELVPPKVIGILVDHFERETLTRDILMKWCLILFVTALVVYIVRFFWRIMIFGSAVKLMRQLRKQLFEHFTRMSSEFYQKRRVGDLMAHATNDLQAIQQTAGAGVLTLVDSLATGGFVLLAMAFTISWKLTLISLIPMPFMALSTSLYGKMLHKRFHKAQAAFSTLNDKVQESINGIKVLKTFGQEEDDIESFRKQSNDVVEKNIAVAKVDSLFDPTISLIVGLSFFLAVAFGAKFVMNGEITIGQLVSFTAYLGLLIWPMLAFGWLFNIIERGRASYDRVSSLLKVEADITDPKDAIRKEPKGDICYIVDSFSYPNEDKVTLQTIHFELKQGQTLGVVGRTGSGKITLVKLLMREFDIEQGDIKFGDYSIKDYSLGALRGSIGYVPQDHFLFSATIAENIGFGKPESSFAEIKQGAKLAYIDHDIIQFPEGYETIVGERGVTLSGGQKQRISIARALMTNPEVLILDDSLSAVDAKTEETILSSLKENRSGKTTIITAHRLSAIEHADLILVLDQGKIVEQGTHKSLMEKRGWYYTMYSRQQLEALVEHGGKVNE